MKTALMELIDLINEELKENTLSNFEGYTLKWVKYRAEKLLEKEKQQMFEFADKYVDFIMGGTETSAKEYYNETYQNK